MVREKLFFSPESEAPNGAPQSCGREKEDKGPFLLGHMLGEAWETPGKEWVLSSVAHKSSRVLPYVSTVSGMGSASDGE